MVDTLLDILADNQNLLGFLVLLIAAAIEYVFPPFPGDTFVLLGGVLVAARGWHPAFVVVAVTVGSVGGAMLDYAAGRWLASHPTSWLARRLLRRRLGLAVERLVAGFARHGALYLVINRFLPGVRAFFFIAAGMAKLPARHVALWGGLSAVAWNVIIIALGYALGGNLEALQTLFTRYTTILWVVLVLAIVVWAVRYLVRTKRLTEQLAHDETGKVGPDDESASD